MENLDALNTFLGENKTNPENKKSEHKSEKQNDTKKLIQKDGLVERVDKVYVTNDGRQLLREVY